MGKPYDRSRVTTDWKCKRRRYLGYEADGTGYESGTAAYELFFGTVIHDAMAAIATFHLESGNVPIDTIAEAAYEQVFDGLTSAISDKDAVEYATEQACLAEGLVRGFHLWAWPRLLASYPEIIVIEQEVMAKDGFMVKPDLILAASDGTLVYVEYKTTSSKNDKWIRSWDLNPQLHSYLHTIRNSLGIEVRAALIYGLYKGYESYGRQNSPFCYGYARTGQPPFVDADIIYTYKAGYKKMPVWEMPGGVKAWVEAMPTEVLAEQFVEVPPIYLNEAVADTFFRQARVREKEIALTMDILAVTSDPEAKQAIMDASFPQNLEACAPSFGSGCPFVGVCHNAEGKHPIQLGFRPRTPHHQPEIDAWEAAERAKLSQQS